MIFVTLGTDKYQFNRLLSIIDTAIMRNEITQPVFAQIGESDYVPENFAFKKYVSFKELRAHIKDASIVIMHAGVGSTLLSLNLGKTPILFPRRKSFGEHVDDHQLEFIERVGQSIKCLIANNSEELIDAIRRHDVLVKELDELESEKDNVIKITEYLMSRYPPQAEK